MKNPTLNADSVALFSSKREDVLPGIVPPAEPSPCTDDSLFERFPRVYIFFRERCFRNDTTRIIRALWGNSQPAAATQLIELGCGPGFYSCQLAVRYPKISVTGVDRSMRQLDRAQRKARRLQVQNCRFAKDNVLDLSHPDESFDVVLAARLFTVLPQQHQAVGEMYRILRPGGHCLIAEPRHALWASLPLQTMWVLARITRTNNGCREPGKATVLSSCAFSNLLASQPWQQLKTWQDGRYQYALCQK